MNTSLVIAKTFTAQQGRSAAQMTKTIKTLGQGSMEEGIKFLCKFHEGKGLADGILGGAIGMYIVHLIRTRNLEKKYLRILDAVKTAAEEESIENENDNDKEGE